MKRQRTLTVEATAELTLGACGRALAGQGWDVFDRGQRGLSAAESTIALRCLNSPARLRVEARATQRGRSELTITGRLAGPGSARIDSLLDGLIARFTAELDGPRRTP